MKTQALRILHLREGSGASATELTELPGQMPADGTLWLATTHAHLAAHLDALQEALARLAGARLLQLHAADLLNAQAPSQYDYTSQYDLLVFHCLAPPLPGQEPSLPGARALAPRAPRAAAPAGADPHPCHGFCRLRARAAVGAPRR